MAITDHNTTKGGLLGLKAAGKSGVVIIPGVEISSKRGDILVLGLTEKLEFKPREMDVDDIVELAGSVGGVVVVPHPYRRSKPPTFVREVRVDALEGFNARTARRLNEKAKRLAEAEGIPVVAGSDAHTLGEVGNGVTGIIADDGKLDDVLEAIRKGAVTIQRENPFRLAERVRYYGVKVRDLVVHGRRYGCAEDL
ncbi:MAG: PHP domain-containing protein [Candidatus Freyarchaeota archaeon]|nr:PHP domain-containing protein [Candidatus Jordarchaeia archaeon]